MTLVRWKKLPHGQTVDLWVGKYRMLRLTRRRAYQIYGPVTVLRAHKGGRSVKRSEVAGKPWRKLTLICGVMVCTHRGSAMLQWRGFEA